MPSLTTLFAEHKNAVVSLNTLTTLRFPIDGTFIEVPVRESSTGFFLKIAKKRFIATTAHSLLLDPELAPFRFPASSSPFVRPEFIFVTVYNVDENRSFVYQATLVSLDPAADLALLRIDPCALWNRCNPTLRCQPWLEWGCSDKTKPGSKVLLISNPVTGFEFDFGPDRATNLLASHAIVADNRYIFPNSEVVTELFAIDRRTVFGESGAPILDNCGKLVAILTLSAGTIDFAAFSFGVPQSFAEPIFKLLAGAFQNCCPNPAPLDPRYFLEIFDPFGSFFIRQKAFLGISYVVPSPIDPLWPYPETSQVKELRGLIVTAVDPNSPAFGRLQVGDLILRISVFCEDKEPICLGPIPPDTVPGSLTLFELPGTVFCVEFQRRTPISTGFLTEIFTLQVPSIAYPPLAELRDLPFVSIERAKISWNRIKTKQTQAAQDAINAILNG